MNLTAIKLQGILLSPKILIGCVSEGQRKEVSSRPFVRRSQNIHGDVAGSVRAGPGIQGRGFLYGIIAAGGDDNKSWMLTVYALLVSQIYRRRGACVAKGRMLRSKGKKLWIKSAQEGNEEACRRCMLARPASTEKIKISCIAFSPCVKFLPPENRDRAIDKDAVN